jgi:1-phosphofructokinase family hexose kinase
MILTVTPNPAIDMTYTIPALNLGESHRVAVARIRSGGKGLNVARVAHQLGHAVLAVAPVGGLGGEEFALELASSGVPHELLHVEAPTRRSIALVESGSSRTTVLNEIGCALDPADWSALLNLVRDKMPDARLLVGSGSLPPEAPEHFYADLVHIAHSYGLPAIIDASGAALLFAAQAGADVLKPNRQELAEATGLTDPVAGAAQLLDAGTGLVLVSLGEEGMLAVVRGDSAPLFARLPAPLEGNPTGAGDAAVAAVACCLAEAQRDIRAILRRATAWSAAAVLSPVAGEVADTIDELEDAVILSRFSLSH